MKETSSVSSEQKGLQVGAPPSINERELNPGALAEPLAVQIVNRAHEISQRGGELSGQSLANWLKAAREILSEDSERPQWNV